MPKMDDKISFLIGVLGNVKIFMIFRQVCEIFQINLDILCTYKSTLLRQKSQFS